MPIALGTTVTCNGGEESHVEKHRYSWQGENLVFVYNKGGRCDEFQMIFTKLP